MARIRTIKPDFWTDEKIIELTPWARLLFIGLWNFCDDAGRMPFSLKRIKLQIFPADDLDISAVFGELRGKGMAVTYTHENQEFLQIINFGKHQKVDHRSPSRHPSPPNSSESPQIPPLEGNGMEGKGMDKRQGAAAPLPAWLDAKSWAEWLEYRRERRLSTKAVTIRKQLKFLEAHNGHHVEIIEQSIRNGWQGLFPLKGKGHETTRGTSAPDRVRRANDRFR